MCIAALCGIERSGWMLKLEWSSGGGIRSDGRELRFVGWIIERAR